MSRYNDVNKGPELALQYEALRTYRNKTKAEKQADYRALNVSRAVAARAMKNIRPFGGTGNLLVLVSTPLADVQPDVTTSGSEQRETDNTLLTALRAILVGRIEITDTETDNVAEIPKFKAAKLFLSRVTNQTPIERTSRFTGARYSSRLRNTMSCPFGRATNAEQEGTAYGDIAASAALDSFVRANPGNNYRLVKQQTVIS